MRAELRRRQPVTLAQKETSEQVKDQVKDANEAGKGKLNQLLGIRGASESTDIWKIRLQLTKPVTWIPLIWGKPCTRVFRLARYSLQIFWTLVQKIRKQ